MLAIISWELPMACKRCSSDKQSKFNSEVNIEFPGREGWDKPTLWVFPEIMVWWGCAFAGFSILEDQFRRLAGEDVA
jgi:hypothetical protein